MDAQQHCADFMSDLSVCLYLLAFGLLNVVFLLCAGVPRDCCQVHTEPAEEESAPCSPRNHVPFGGQSELEATLNLNAMNQSPNPWHVSFSYARALQNSVLKTWKGEEANWGAAQDALIKRAAANSAAQQGKYDSSQEDKAAGESTYEKGYVY